MITKESYRTGRIRPNVWRIPLNKRGILASEVTIVTVLSSSVA